MTREQIIDACHFDEPEQILAYIEELEAKIAKLKESRDDDNNKLS